MAVRPPALVRRLAVVVVFAALGTACSADAASVTAPVDDPGTPATVVPTSVPTPTPVPVFACAPFPTYAEGPWYLEDIDTKSDLTEDVDGVPLTVRLTFVDATDCSPIDGQLVDLWGADPAGAYSGLIGPAAEDDGRRWLRGRQTTDAEGTATFETVFPGWIGGVPPHLTLTTPFSDDQWFTARLALDDAVVESVYTEPAYADRGPHPTRSADTSDPTSIVVPTRVGDGWVLDLELPVDRAALREPPASAHLSRPVEIDERRPPTAVVEFENAPDEVQAMFIDAGETLELDAKVLYDAFKFVGPTNPPDVPAIAESLGVTVDELAAALPLLAAGPPGS